MLRPKKKRAALSLKAVRAKIKHLGVLTGKKGKGRAFRGRIKKGRFWKYLFIIYYHWNKCI